MPRFNPDILVLVATLLLVIGCDPNELPKEVAPIDEVLVQVTDIGYPPEILSINPIVLTISATIGKYPQYSFSRIEHTREENRINLRVYALRDPTLSADSLVTLDAMRYVIPGPFDSVMTIIVHQPDSTYLVRYVEPIQVRADSQWSIYTPTSANLPSNQVFSLAIAANDEVWGGTDEGVFRFDGEFAESYADILSEDESNAVRALATDPSGNVWAGFFLTDHIAKFDGTRWSTSKFPEIENYIYHDDVHTIHASNDSLIWVGTHEGLLLGHDGNDWFSGDATLNDLYVREEILSIDTDLDGKLWILLPDGRVGTFNGSSWSFMEAPERTIREIDFAPNGVAWFSGDSILFSLENGDWKPFIIDLPSGAVITINSHTIDSYGEIWMATSNGLLHYDHTTWTLYDSTNSGYFGSGLHDVAIDSQDRIWMASEDAGLILFRNGN